jgi:hypothetical protein
LTIVGATGLLGNGKTQMVMQQSDGNFWLYSHNAASNSLSGTLVGAIGSNFHVVGFGPLGTSGQDEMLMQNAGGAFKAYQYNASETRLSARQSARWVSHRRWSVSPLTRRAHPVLPQAQYLVVLPIIRSTAQSVS